jgi:hypothetical protein
MPLKEAVTRLKRVANILVQDAKDPTTQARAGEILALVEIIEKESEE